MNKTPDGTPEQLLAALRWRYAVKKFDPTKKLSEDVIGALLRGLVLSPSSFGAQPWLFLSVENPEIREKLKAVSWKQGQIVDASHLVVFAARKSVSETDVDKLMAATAAARGVPETALAGYKKMIIGFMGQFKNDEHVQAWTTRQLYLALGNLLTSAAVIGVDACPIEGIDPAAYDQILGLAEGEYSTQVVCALGFRAEDDAYASIPKVRYAFDEMVRVIK